MEKIVKREQGDWSEGRAEKMEEREMRGWRGESENVEGRGNGTVEEKREKEK